MTNHARSTKRHRHIRDGDIALQKLVESRFRRATWASRGGRRRRNIGAMTDVGR